MCLLCKICIKKQQIMCEMCDECDIMCDKCFQSRVQSDSFNNNDFVKFLCYEIFKVSRVSND